MKRNSLRMWLPAALLLTLGASAHAQHASEDFDYEYHVKVQEILTEEDAKNFDFALRPLFDVAPQFDEEHGMLIYRTHARLTRSIIEPKLADYGLHVESMIVNPARPTNAISKD